MSKFLVMSRHKLQKLDSGGGITYSVHSTTYVHIFIKTLIIIDNLIILIISYITDICSF